MKTLLVVDDSEIIRNRIGRGISLGRQGFRVVATAANGQEAIDLYKQHRPDVVTMDLTMPKIDGLGAISAITDWDENATILVISALSDKATGIRALELGACGFICKPFTDIELLDALDEVVSDCGCL